MGFLKNLGQRTDMWRLQRPQVLRIPQDHFAKLPYVWGSPRNRATFLGGPHKKDYSIWGSILGSPYLGNYHMGL